MSEAPRKCGECALWAGQLNIGTCEWEKSPVFKQDRWFTDKPVCLDRLHREGR